VTREKESLGNALLDKLAVQSDWDGRLTSGKEMIKDGGDKRG
jgi:hypothetical protein